MKNRPYGLVVCGGKSSRMGSDKGLLTYYESEQRYHVYGILERLCQQVFLSCNKMQADQIPDTFPVLVDAPEFGNIGPMAALLTAFKHYPDQDFLIAGCDYPFITVKELDGFLLYIKNNQVASAFYNQETNFYEPLIGWYSIKSYKILLTMYQKKQYSLQYFLKENNAGKYTNFSPECITSVDTPEGFRIAKNIIDSKRHS